MNRVEAAIREGRCVLAVGGRAMQNPEIQMELRRRAVPTVVLGADPVSPAQPLTLAAIAPATAVPGGSVPRAAPAGPTDGAALNELSKLIKQAPQKPQLFVAAKAFNPFAMPMSMRLLKFAQLKMRAQDFIASLPISAPEIIIAAAPEAAATLSAAVAAEAPASERKDKDAGPQAPRPFLIGREDELARLGALLSEDGGPILVTGPSGVGRRWLVEKALEGAGLKRLPDFSIGRGVGADTLAGRVAAAAKAAGHSELDDMLRAADKNPDASPSPAELSAAFLAALQHEGLKDRVLVIHHLHRLLDRRDNSFYREGRLELLLRAALKATTALRIVIISEAAPTFYREGEAQSLRILPVGGIRGKELHALFAAWHAPEFPRDNFGPISERTHGHPFYARQLAIEVRDGGDIKDILERPKFLKAASLSDLEPLKRNLKKRLSKLDERTLDQLHSVALFREPASPQQLQGLGINRNDRLNLVALGLLEQTPIDGGERLYYVHALIREHLDVRKVLEFGAMEQLARTMLDQARDAEKAGDVVGALAARQDANLLLIKARKGRNRVRLPYPDTDAIIDEIIAILRRREPRFDIARMRVNETLKFSPKNTELLLCDAEVRVAENRKVEEVEAVYDHIAQTCPTPEAVHHEVTYHLNRNARGKAAGALERGIELFPESGRLRRRLAGLYLRQNRLEAAQETLKGAADIEPMMPDNYSMLGEVYTRMGAAHWEDADQVIQEARRIDGENPIHMWRAANLLRARALVDAEQRTELLQQADALLQEALKLEPESGRILTLAATVVLDLPEGDLEKATWMLKKATKNVETVEALTQRARLHIRQGDLGNADKTIARAIKKEKGYHPAQGVRGELLLAQDNPVGALEAFKTARELCPRVAPERATYDAAFAQIEERLLATGLAAEPAPEAAAPAPEGETEGVGLRREPGKTTVRRTRDGHIVDVADAPAETDASPAEDAPEAEAVEAAAEDAPASAEVEAAAEDAPEAAEAVAAPAEAEAVEAAAEVEAAAPVEVEVAAENADEEPPPAEA